MIQRTLLAVIAASTVCAAVALAAPQEPLSLAEADALFGAGKFTEAAAVYRALAAADPQQGAAWFGAARALINAGDHDGAIEAFAEARALKFREGFAMFGTARAYAGKGDAGRMFEALERAAAAGTVASLQLLALPEFQRFKADSRFDGAVQALRPCRAPEYRQFDFWLGDWDVQSAAGRTAHNRITSTQGGCALLEEYDTPTGYRGVSLSYYDAASSKWHQTWIDNQGRPIIHSGGLEHGSIVLADETEGATINRTTWTPGDDGTLRQHWEITSDGGETWNTIFDGTYSKREPGS